MTWSKNPVNILKLFLKSASLKSSYILQFKIACISFYTTLQKGHTRKFSAKPSYRPVSASKLAKSCPVSWWQYDFAVIFCYKSGFY